MTVFHLYRGKFALKIGKVVHKFKGGLTETSLTPSVI